MADFPNTVYPEYEQSGEDWIDPLLADRSRSGAFRARRLQTGKKRAINLTFRLLTNAERTTIETHYDAHRALTFNFTWPDGSGGPYVVAYAERNAIKFTRAKPGRWNGAVLLEEA
jgi:hypothetical protein